MDTSTENELRSLMTAFLEENAKLNLSALRSEEACWHGNILDSLSAKNLTLFDSESPLSILDVGTGGGFPLLVLALTYPHHQFTGLDSTRKKCLAIERILAKQNITNVSIIADRAESLGHDKRYREHFDIVTARAVAPLATLLEFLSPFCRPGGHIVCWKSLHIEQELQESQFAQTELACEFLHKHEYTLPGDWGTRQLLVFAKRSVLPKKYPRELGIPGKQPLSANAD